MTDFDEWYDSNLERLLKGNLHDAAQEAWNESRRGEVLFAFIVEAILAADGAIDNGMPDLALKQIQNAAGKLRQVAAEVKEMDHERNA
jgi:hypothetical protein